MRARRRREFADALDQAWTWLCRAARTRGGVKEKGRAARGPFSDLRKSTGSRFTTENTRPGVRRPRARFPYLAQNPRSGIPLASARSRRVRSSSIRNIGHVAAPGSVRLHAQALRQQLPEGHARAAQARCRRRTGPGLDLGLYRGAYEGWRACLRRIFEDPGDAAVTAARVGNGRTTSVRTRS